MLGDASQIRSTLQNFSSVLEEMSQVCDITVLHDQLLEADHRVSEVHGSFTVPLSQLEHAAAVSLRFYSSCTFRCRHVTRHKQYIILKLQILWRNFRLLFQWILLLMQWTAWYFRGLRTTTALQVAKVCQFLRPLLKTLTSYFNSSKTKYTLTCIDIHSFCPRRCKTVPRYTNFSG